MAAPSLSALQKDFLLMMLAAGYQERTITDFWKMCYGGRRLASSTISYYRKKCRAEIDRRRAERIDDALTAGLALKAERIAALKEHALQLEAIKYVADKHGRLHNERAWRQTLEDIAIEMGERKPKEGVQGEQTIKVYMGVDPDKV